GDDLARPAADRPVEAPRDPYAEPLHALAELAPRRRLGDEVDVIALDRVVDDPEARPATHPGERPGHDAMELPVPERPDEATEPNRDVGRPVPVDGLAAQVRHEAPPRIPARGQ